MALVLAVCMHVPLCPTPPRPGTRSIRAAVRAGGAFMRAKALTNPYVAPRGGSPHAGAGALAHGDLNATRPVEIIHRPQGAAPGIPGVCLGCIAPGVCEARSGSGEGE